MAFFCYDIETLGKESTSVMLSAAITHFTMDLTDDLDEEFASLIENSLFVKFDAAEQIEKYNRIVSKDTLKWWESQSEASRKLAFTPSKNDVSAIDGIELIRNYIKKYSDKQDNIIWIRGSLDQLVTESLCTKIGVEPIEHFTSYRDIRTAVDLLAETSKRGYCQLRLPFDMNLLVKRIPTHDIAFDVLQLKYFK